MSDTRQDMRMQFITAWDKHLAGESLDALNTQIVSVITKHPEYHAAMTMDNLDQAYRTDNNPFLHLAMHCGLLDQLSTNRPRGIQTEYQKLCAKLGDEHQAEHIMMETMANYMWEAGRRRE